MKRILRWIRGVALAPILFYRRRLSSLKSSPTCRFTPTCSAYALHAVNEWGVIIGLILFVLRLLRCQPLCKGGHDPVPRIKRKLVPLTEPLGKGARYSFTVKNRKYPYLSYYERYV